MAKQNTSRRVALRVALPAADWLSTEELEHEIASWIADGRRRGYSPRTLAHRKDVGGKLMWFLRLRRYDRCGREEVTAFLDYLTTAHEEGGRFERLLTKPLLPSTLKFYFTRLQGLFNWLVGGEVLSESPMRKLEKPRAREPQIRPFTAEELERLFAAAGKRGDPVRDEAILLMLFDTGVRASELCALTIGDFDLGNERCRVMGKGGKERYVQIGEAARRAVRRLIGEYRDPAHPERPAPKDQAVFCARRGKQTGEALTRTGLYQLIRAIGKEAGIDARCSPHTFRHSFAVNYLRNQGGVFPLQMQLGHSSLAMTRRYVNLAEADLAEEHRRASPADALFGRRKKR